MFSGKRMQKQILRISHTWNWMNAIRTYVAVLSYLWFIQNSNISFIKSRKNQSVLMMNCFNPLRSKEVLSWNSSLSAQPPFLQLSPFLLLSSNSRILLKLKITLFCFFSHMESMEISSCFVFMYFLSLYLNFSVRISLTPSMDLLICHPIFHCFCC